jgi:hypothetical protein
VKKYIYHCRATFYTSPGVAICFDGITEATTPIDSIERYRATKATLAPTMGVDTARCSDIMIDSLTLLHTRRE